MDIPPPPASESASRIDTASQTLKSSPRPKRRKIQTACRNCRDSKIRCDGAAPACLACERRGLVDSCIYERAKISSQRHNSRFDRRAQLQEQLQNLDRQTFNGNERTVDGLSPRSGHASPLANDTSTSGRHIIGQGLEDHGSYQVDALATVHAAEDDDCLYGGSSTIAFVHQFTKEARAAHEALPSQPQDYSAKRRPAQLDFDTSFARAEIILERAESASVYPPRRKADDLVHCFWEYIHPVFPVVHKTSFITDYEKIWLAEDFVDPNDGSTELEQMVFTSNLNLIFALGCQFSTLIPASKRSSAANDFYQRSRHLFLFDILDSKSISVVQMLLLTGIYMQSTPHASRCWNSIGLAIRTAQSLGLHLDYVGRRPESQLICQMRRRIWHTCILLDRLTAMTFGRPTMLSASWNVPIPLLIDDEYLSVEGEGVQPLEVPSRMGLFVSSCKLFEILQDILFNFYADDSGHGSSKKLMYNPDASNLLLDVMDYNHRLDRFNDSIPEYLRTSGSFQITASEKNNCVNLQQQVLYCRFLYTRLLSLRPLLLLAAKSEQHVLVPPSTSKQLSSSLDEELIRWCCNLSVRTAHSLVETIHQHLDTAYKSSGWHSVYFTFAAATILLASLKCQDMDTELRDTSFEVCWDQCVSILNHYKEQIHSASRAIQVLQTLRSQIMATRVQDTLLGIGLIDDEQTHFDPSLHPEFSQFNSYGADCITDAWFGQQFLNLD